MKKSIHIRLILSKAPLNPFIVVWSTASWGNSTYRYPQLSPRREVLPDNQFISLLGYLPRITSCSADRNRCSVTHLIQISSWILRFWCSSVSTAQTQPPQSAVCQYDWDVVTRSGKPVINPVKRCCTFSRSILSFWLCWDYAGWDEQYSR